MQKNKIYVSGLAYSIDDDELKEAFSQYGEVTFVRVIKDRDSGQSRGFGFVEFATDEQAQAAIDGMNDQEISGRKVRVSIAKERAPRSDGGGHRGGDRGGNNDRGFDGSRSGDNFPRMSN